MNALRSVLGTDSVVEGQPTENLATDDAAPPLAAWSAVAVLCLALLMSFTDRMVINLPVDPIRSDLGLTDLEISLLQGAGFAVIFALVGLPSGRLADRANRRNVKQKAPESGAFSWNWVS
jgi:MFS family permease